MKVIIDADVMLYQSMPKAVTSFHGASEIFRLLIQQIVDNTWADEYVLCFSGAGQNFRKNCFPSYKANRKGIVPNPIMAPLKDWAMELPHAIDSPGGEADDYMFIIAAECVAKGEDFVIASIDKDLKTFPCKYYNMRTRKLEVITPTYAADFIMEQFVTGDACDGIPGLKGYAAKTANKYLADYTTYEDKWNGIKALWKEKKGDDWEEAFNQDSNLVVIRRSTTDLEPLEFANRSFNDLQELLGFHLPDHEQA